MGPSECPPTPEALLAPRPALPGLVQPSPQRRACSAPWEDLGFLPCGQGAGCRSHRAEAEARGRADAGRASQGGNSIHKGWWGRARPRTRWEAGARGGGPASQILPGPCAVSALWTTRYLSTRGTEVVWTLCWPPHGLGGGSWWSLAPGLADLEAWACCQLTGPALLQGPDPRGRRG